MIPVKVNDSESELRSILAHGDVRALHRPDASTNVQRLLWQERAFIWRLTAIGLIVGIALAFVIPATYQSTIRVVPPARNDTMAMALMAMAPGAAASGMADLLGVKTSSGLVLGLLKSGEVEDAVIAKFDLSKVYKLRYREDLRKKLSDRIDITDDAKSEIVSITITDRNPERAAAMASSYVDELNKALSSINTSAAHRERVFLEERLAQVKVELDNSAQELSRYASKNTAVDIPEQAKAMVTAAAQLQGELIAAQSELRGLQQIYSDNNVRISSLRARIAELQRQLEKLGGNDDANAPHDLYPAIRQLPLLAVKYGDLYRQTKIEETVYEMLTKQYELAKVQEAKEVPSVSVVESALVPQKRSGPPRTLIILSLSVFGFLYAVLWCIGRSKWSSIPEDDEQKALLLEIVNTIRGSTISSKYLHRD